MSTCLHIFMPNMVELTHWFNTLAWDISGKYDPSNCLDLDPEELYQTCPEVKEPNNFSTQNAN